MRSLTLDELEYLYHRDRALWRRQSVQGYRPISIEDFTRWRITKPTITVIEATPERVYIEIKEPAVIV